MGATRQLLHALLDDVDEAGLDTLYTVMMSFIPPETVSSEELALIDEGFAEIERGEFVRLKDIRLD
ncbi:MAG: hypothetical protein LBI44_04520 [Oscillospiraceae bacterium]|jgi:predicted transcriptional regulator|nr:hypothetical protein [Oscillospiraceae bacterium]